MRIPKVSIGQEIYHKDTESTESNNSPCKVKLWFPLCPLVFSVSLWLKYFSRIFSYSGIFRRRPTDRSCNGMRMSAASRTRLALS